MPTRTVAEKLSTSAVPSAECARHQWARLDAGEVMSEPRVVCTDDNKLSVLVPGQGNVWDVMGTAIQTLRDMGVTIEDTMCAQPHQPQQMGAWQCGNPDHTFHPDFTARDVTVTKVDFLPN